MGRLIHLAAPLLLLLLAAPTLAGDLTFAPTTYVLGTGVGAEGVAAADLDGDGDLDLAIGNRYTGHASNNRLVLWRNDGAGGMSVFAQLPLLSLPTDVQAADLDGDGDQDLVVGAFVPGNSFSVFLNDGSAGFAPRADYFVNAIPTGLALGDLNGDGRPDLAVTLRSVVDHHVGVVMNDGAGGFGGTQVRYPVGGGPGDVVMGDLDGDGALDLVTVDRDADQVSALRNLGGGAFGAALPFAVGVSPNQVTVADLDGDGHLDLAVSNGQSAFVSLLMGDGNGGFPTGSDLAYPSLGGWGVVLEDLDGDGLPELVAGDFSDQVNLFQNMGGGAFAYAGQVATGYDPRSIIAADLDGDGDADLATADDGIGGAASMSVLRNDTAPAPGTPYCFGVACPCGNDDPDAGCANSAGGGAALVASGSASVLSDDLLLTASGVPINQFGLIYMGGATASPALGDGIRCVGVGAAGLFRFPVQNSGASGGLTLGPGLVAASQGFSPPGNIGVGSTWYFQAWFRDPPGPCGSGSNLSNGLAVTFLP